MSAHTPGWTSDPITGWVRDASGKEIFRPVGITTKMLPLVLAAPDMAEALRAMLEHFPRNGASMTSAEGVAHAAAIAALAKAGL